MSRLTMLTPDLMDARQLELYGQLTGNEGSDVTLTNPDGSLVGPFNLMVHQPRLGAALQRLGGVLLFRGTLTARAREIAILCVAAHHRSEFERSAHESIGRSAGLTENEMAAIAVNGALTLSDPVEACVLRVSRTLLEVGDLDDKEYADAEKVLGEGGLIELSTVVGYYSLVALQLRLFRVPG
ncbi:MAG: carboxymuconolactone decarboxylase family protein [Ilumatobacteraceae bacterium]